MRMLCGMFLNHHAAAHWQRAKFDHFDLISFVLLQFTSVNSCLCFSVCQSACILSGFWHLFATRWRVVLCKLMFHVHCVAYLHCPIPTLARSVICSCACTFVSVVVFLLS